MIKLGVLVVSLIIVYILHAGYSLQCYSCVNSTGQLCSPTQCNSTQVSLTCAAPNDTCLDVRARFSNYTGKEAETELQLKACGTMEDYKRLGNEICTKTEGKCRYTCCQDDLCNNDSPAERLEALKCYHCEGPIQCEHGRKETYCPSNNMCGIVHNRTAQLHVERRSCVTREEYDALKKVCNGTGDIDANGTSWCQFHACYSDLCNLAPCVHLAPFFIALFTMFGMISME